MQKSTFSPIFLIVSSLVMIPAAMPHTAQQSSDEQVQEHFQAAKDAERNHNYEKAIAEYQVVLKERPQVAEIHTNLGLLYYLQHRDNEAIDAFRQALQIKPAM